MNVNESCSYFENGCCRIAGDLAGLTVHTSPQACAACRSDVHWESVNPVTIGLAIAARREARLPFAHLIDMAREAMRKVRRLDLPAECVPVCEKTCLEVSIGGSFYRDHTCDGRAWLSHVVHDGVSVDLRIESLGGRWVCRWKISDQEEGETEAHAAIDFPFLVEFSIRPNASPWGEQPIDIVITW
jgi:hypothetical protein